jgi:hypothetical protein
MIGAAMHAALLGFRPHGVIVSLQRIPEGSETRDVYVKESNQSTQYHALQPALSPIRRLGRADPGDGTPITMEGCARASRLVRRAWQENGLQKKQSQDFASLDATIQPEQRIPTAVRTDA